MGVKTSSACYTNYLSFVLGKDSKKKRERKKEKMIF